MPPYIMHNPIMPYAWGSRTAIAELLGQAHPTAQPQAELWMGAHPKAPSRIFRQGNEVNLNHAIDRDPHSFLGRCQARQFNGHLPFLMKILAAEAPLSIQAHPDQETARQGFEIEEQQGLAPNDPRRCFKDCRHKPELIYAMTPFTALCGFQPEERIRAQLAPLLGRQYRWLLDPITPGGADSERPLEAFFRGLLTLSDEDKRRCLAAVDRNLTTGGTHETGLSWVSRLMTAYPGDMGALAPLILNLVELSPGQALYLRPRTLHAYLGGMGLEIMANSDNVLRGGLTPKYMDLTALSQAVDFVSEAPAFISPRRDAGSSCFEPPVREFALVALSISQDQSYQQPQMAGLEILLCTRGELVIQAAGTETGLRLQKGQSAVLPFTMGAYRLTGLGEGFIGRVPDKSKENP